MWFIYYCTCAYMIAFVSICESIHVLQSPLCGNVCLVHHFVWQHHWPTNFQGFSPLYFLSYHSSDKNKYIDHSIQLFQSLGESKLKLSETLEVFGKNMISDLSFSRLLWRCLLQKRMLTTELLLLLIPNNKWKSLKTQKKLQISEVSVCFVNEHGPQFLII